MSDLDVPVLIVGGSLVGMSSAMLLGYHGVQTLTVENHRGTAIHPRAAQVTQRTMEIFRTLGIEDIIRRRSEEQFSQDGAIVAVETLAGRELATFIANLNEGIRDVSPSERIFISQSLLEPVLKARAEELGAELRFNTELKAFEQDSSGVTAVLRHRGSGKAQTVRAKYLIGADGAHSVVRKELKIATRGRGVFSKSATIYFKADVGHLLRGRNLSVIYVNNPVLRGFLRFEKPFETGFLAINALGDPSNPVMDVAGKLNEQRCMELIRYALGSETLPVHVENVMAWDAAADVAEHFSEDRVFLAGDSAHCMPPNGGFGGNTGIQDAHNLAWKLAMVLRGTAGPDLLETYDAERRPVGVFTTEQAYSRYVTRTAPFLGTDDIQPIADDLEIELGYVYDSPAIDKGEKPAPAHENPRDSHARPGTRAPHLWIQRKGEQISTLDLFGKSFVAIGGPDADGWCDAARTVAARLRVDLEAYRAEARVRAPGQGSPYISASRAPMLRGELADAYALGPTDAVLIRPDGFVAWRSDTGQVESAFDHAQIMERVLRTALMLKDRS